MKFVIASLPRCGSTALYRVLTSCPETAIAYEPPFFRQGVNLASVKLRAFDLLRRHDGMKHVWDPNGWPFRNPDHVSSLGTLAGSSELIRPNRAVLDCAERVILLRRRNGFDRTLSDLLGQQTQLWGHDPDKPHDAAEADRYRAAVRRRAPATISPNVFGWYMCNAESWEDRIVESLRPSSAKTFFYEDLFSPNMSGAWLACWQELFDWIGIQPDFLSREVQEIVAPASKLNSPDIYRRIPNYQQLEHYFGERVAA